MRNQALTVTIAAALLLAACPNDEPGPGDVSSDLGIDTLSDGGGDGTVGDATDAEGETADAEGETADGGGDAADADVIEPGAYGWGCQENSECNSGYCIEGYTSKICTKTCEGDCPDGYACRQDLAAFPDVIFVCVPRFAKLCYPCDTNAECNVEETEANACVSYGDEGSFCGGSCSGATCPPGWVCSVVTDVNGATSQQCIPEPEAEGVPGFCECPQGAVAEAASTTCYQTDDLGSCPGTRTCTAEGLTDCDAPPPAEDVCNGVDDDCDGETDEAHVPEVCSEDNDFGTCEGETVCEGESGPVCNAAVPAAESCDGTDDDCDGDTDEAGADGCVDHWLDADGDGFGVGEPQCLCGPEGDFTATQDGDCDDDKANVSPDADEICNEVDDDCDGATDEENAVGCSLWNKDEDADGFGHATDAKCFCGPTGDYTAKSNTDCDDTTDQANPGTSEVCDGIDNDCDQNTDEEGAGNCTLYYADGDGDDYGSTTEFACLCGPSDPYLAPDGGDCDDSTDQISPGVLEQCGDGVDNDCDGLTDESGAEGCTTFYRDGDDDGYGIDGDSQCLCAPAGVYDATEPGDCNDNNTNVNPGAAEACNGLNDDCDDDVDEAGATGCTTYYNDADFDGYGVPDDSACLCAPVVPFVGNNPDDCDDTNPFANPGAQEVCNGIDDDCNGQTDEGASGTCTPFYKDGDGDGWGVDGDSQCLCGPQGEYTALQAGDCDDTVDTVHPFAAEVCNGTVDDDCDGATDELGAQGCANYYFDGDGDDYGLLGDFQCLCAPAGSYQAPDPGDCDDTVGTTNPGAAETCNDVDDDCDGATDETGATGCTDYLRDSDLDGYGVTGDAKCLCVATTPYLASQGGDCNDADGSVNPGQSEVCNGKDDDCSGAADDPGTAGCIDFYKDGDADNFGVTGDSQCLCGPSGTYTATSPGDCADGDADVNPAVVETCNGVDDDCDSATDEAGALGCTNYLKDADFDDAGVTGDLQCLCQPDTIYDALSGGDCDDGDATVGPGQDEVCDGADNDCDGATDEQDATGCTVFFKDVDDDGYGVTGDTRCLCAATGVYRAAQGGDCNDGAAAVNPGAAEICNGIDDDCGGGVDVGASDCITYFLDGDGDTWGVSGDSQCLCAPTGMYTATSPGDCADGDAGVNPAAIEACNGADDDCDSATDEAGSSGCTVYLRDGDDDTYGVTGDFQCLCAPGAVYKATTGGDCDDTDEDVSPGDAESCATPYDDDCDGQVNEENAGGCTTYLKDIDGDTYGVTGAGKCLCAPAGSFTATTGGDCNDSTTLISPAATEFCNGTDDDCDGEIDQEGASGCVPTYLDEDSDGWGVGTARCLCGADGDYKALAAVDCDDGEPLMNPGLPEVCGSPVLDENCSGVVDEPGAQGCTPYFQDDDGDGYGTDASETCLCTQPAGFVASGGDCDDSAGGGGVNPGEVEVCNGVDDDCDGTVDEDCDLATTGWPTHKFDKQRTGTNKGVTGPATNSLRWKTTLPAIARPNETTPVIVSDGHVVYLYDDKVYKLDITDGSTIWETQLDAAFTNTQQNQVRATLTVREGGTMYVPTGNGMSMLAPDGSILWYRSLGSDPEDAVRGAPSVDAEGNAYFISNKFFTKMSPAGDIVWQLSIPNFQYTPGHAAWNAAGSRLYFTSTNHVVYAVEKSGLVSWTFVAIGDDIDGSVSVGPSGRIYAPMGNHIHAVQDNGTSATEVGYYNSGTDIDCDTAVWWDMTGEYTFASPNGNSGVRKLDTPNLNQVWSASISKGQSPTAAPIFDSEGTMYIGSNTSTFHAIRIDNSVKWTFSTDHTEVDGSAALAEGLVVFADDDGVVYCIAD